MVTSSDSNKPRWERRKDARPQELVAAALDLFVERGYAATRLDDVAAQAGVSKGTLYLYFSSKEELFKAVINESLVPFLDRSRAMSEAYEGTSEELLRLFVLNWWEQIGSTKLAGISKLMMAESGNFPDLAAFYHDEVIGRANAVMHGILERGMARGEFRRMDVNLVNRIMSAPIIMLMMWQHSFGICQVEAVCPESYLDCALDLFLQGLRNTEQKNNNNSPSTTA